MDANADKPSEVADAPAGPPQERAVDVRMSRTHLPALYVFIVGLGVLWIGWMDGEIAPIHLWTAGFLLGAAVLFGGLDVLLGKGLLPREIRLSDQGVRICKRLVAWDEIALVECRLAGVQVRTSDGKKHGLLNHPNVYREVLPELLRRRPDLDVSKRLLRRLDDPDRPARIARWVALPWATVGLLVAMEPLLVHTLPIMSFATLALVMLPFLLLATLLGVGPPVTQRQAFIWEVGVFCGLAASLPRLYTFANWSAVAALDAVAISFGVLCLAAAAVAAGATVMRGKMLSVLGRVVLAVVFLIPPANFAAQSHRHFRKDDLTPLLPGTPSPAAVWSPDGRYCIDFLADGQTSSHTLLDVMRFRSHPLPRHEGAAAWGLSNRVLIRRTHDRTKLLAYRVPDGPEVELVTRPDFPYITSQPISPGGLVCWTQESPPDGRIALRLWNTGTDAQTSLSAPLPAPEAEWIGWRWQDAETLALLALSPKAKGQAQPPQTLHVVRFRPWPFADRQPEVWSSPERLTGWNVSPDGEHAFALKAVPAGLEGSAPAGGSVVYVNLRDGRTVELGGSTVPVWSPDSRWGLRVARPTQVQPGLRVCRFDVASGVESAHPLPTGWSVASLSPLGRYAILKHDDRIYPLMLFNVIDGRRHCLPVNFISTITLTDDWPRGHGLYSMWSPTEKQFLLPEVVISSPPQFKLWLVDVPGE